MVSIPRLLAPFCHLQGKMNATGTFFSIWYLRFPKWSTILTVNRDVPKILGNESSEYIRNVTRLDNFEIPCRLFLWKKVPKIGQFYVLNFFELDKIHTWANLSSTWATFCLNYLVTLQIWQIKNSGLKTFLTWICPLL